MDEIFHVDTNSALRDDTKGPVLYLPINACHVRQLEWMDEIDAEFEFFEPITLTVVVITCQNYSRKEIDEFDTNRFLAKCVRQGTVIKEGMLIEYDSQDLKVVYAEPVLQGVPNSSTNILLTEFKSNGNIISLVEDNDISKGLRAHALNSNVETPDHCVYVNWNYLYAIGKFNGDFARLVYSSGSRIVQIFGMDGLANNGLYMTSNMKQQLDCGYIEISEESIDEVPVADSVTLTRLLPPLITNDIYEELKCGLEEYFEKKRILVKGDIICIRVDEKMAAIKSLVNLDMNYYDEMKFTFGKPKFAFVKYIVDDICGPATSNSFWIGPSHTVITENGSRPMDIAPNIPNSLFSDTANELYGICHTILVSASQSQDRNSTASPILLLGAPGIGKKYTIAHVCDKLQVSLLSCNLFDLLCDTLDSTSIKVKAFIDKAINLKPCVLLIENVQAFNESWTGQEGCDAQVIMKEILEILSHYPIVFVATAPNLDMINKSIAREFVFVLKMSLPSETQRKLILESALYRLDSNHLMDLKTLARHTAGLSPLELNSIVTKAIQVQIMAIPEQMRARYFKSKFHISNEKIQDALTHIRKINADLSGAPSIPNVQWSDIGGLDYVRDTILETIQLPLLHPELFSSGVKKRSGVLLYGPPGTGKTLVAKAVATTLKLNFFSVKGPELLNMYIGESEANVRNVFEKARQAKPCVIFFDELDSIAPQRGDKGDSGGVMDRIVSQLLAELDGMGSTDEVFVIGATNRPDLLDSSLLRPGRYSKLTRFDRLLYLGVADSFPVRLSLMTALTRKFHLHPDCQLDLIVSQLPSNLTGADFYALCSDAMSRAIERKISEFQKEIDEWNAVKHDGYPNPTSTAYYLDHIIEKERLTLTVCNQDFLEASKVLNPSVSPQELQRYAKIREQFEPVRDREESAVTESPMSKKGKGKMKQPPLEAL